MDLFLLAAVALFAWLFISKSQAQGLSAPAPPAGDSVPPPDASVTTSSQDDGGIAAYNPPSPTDQIAQAIFEQEGNQPGDIALDNNNPGALRYLPGAIGESRGFPVAPDFSTGWNDLEDKINSTVAGHPDWDFYDFFQYWLGQRLGGPTVTDQGDSDAYAEAVASKLGVQPTTVISSLYAG